MIPYRLTASGLAATDAVSDPAACERLAVARCRVAAGLVTAARTAISAAAGAAPDLRAAGRRAQQALRLSRLAAELRRFPADLP